MCEKNILLIGRMGSGKDFVGDWLEREHGYKKVAIASTVKSVFKNIFGCGPNKSNECDRRALQRIGLFGRKFSRDIWCRAALPKVEEKRTVITDCRFPNETKFFNDFLKIKLNVSDETRKRRLRNRDGIVHEKLLNHESEKHVDDMNADMEIEMEEDGKIPPKLIALFG